MIYWYRLGKRKVQVDIKDANAVSSRPGESTSGDNEVQIQTGIGRITSSGTTIQGHYTDFMKQLHVGDAIIITHPTRYF